MKFNRWGRGEFEVYQLGLGIVALGMPYGLSNIPPPEERKSIALIHRAFEAGINYIDTASAYGNSEKVVVKSCTSAPFQTTICTNVTVLQECDGCTGSRGLLPFSLFLMPWRILPSAAGLIVGASAYMALRPPCIPSLFQTSLLLCKSHIARGRKKEINGVLRSIFLQGLFSAATTQLLPTAMSSFTKALGEFELCAADAGISTAELALCYGAYDPSIRISLFVTTRFEEWAKTCVIMKQIRYRLIFVLAHKRSK